MRERLKVTLKRLRGGCSRALLSGDSCVVFARLLPPCPPPCPCCCFLRGVTSLFLPPDPRSPLPASVSRNSYSSISVSKHSPSQPQPRGLLWRWHNCESRTEATSTHLPSQRSGTNWPGQRGGPRLSLTSLAIGAILDIRANLAIGVDLNFGVNLAIRAIGANLDVGANIGTITAMMTNLAIGANLAISDIDVIRIMLAILAMLIAMPTLVMRVIGPDMTFLAIEPFRWSA